MWLPPYYQAYRPGTPYLPSGLEQIQRYWAEMCGNAAKTMYLSLTIETTQTENIACLKFRWAVL